MIRLRAEVRRGKHGGEQYPAGHSLGDNSGAAQIPVPDWIEIEQGHEGGYLLIHIYLREGPFIHTWHATIEEAKEEARLEFSIQDDEWAEEIVETP